MLATPNPSRGHARGWGGGDACSLRSRRDAGHAELVTRTRPGRGGGGGCMQQEVTSYIIMRHMPLLKVGGGGGVHAAGGHILHHHAPYAIAESGLGSVVGE